MVVHRSTGQIDHRVFSDLTDYLDPRDCLILNTTRVIPARFEARRATGGRVRGLFLHEEAPGRWIALLAGSRRVRSDEALRMDRWTLSILERRARGEHTLAVWPPDSAATVLNEIGHAPLPPYIHRPADESEDLRRHDRAEYQTIYAAQPGAIAAPTAGMHFTQALLDRIIAMGVARADVVLHVGLGTFSPVEVDDLADHPMHREAYELPQASVDTILARRASGGRAVAVGSTAVRVLESCAAGGLHAASGWTDLLIQPPYRFAATDALITNFHLPGTTLLALVMAFAGCDLLREAYRVAIEQRYRFFSYGDAMLIV